MKHIRTSSGFEIELPEERIDDYELFEELVKIETRNEMSGLPMVVERILKDDRERLFDHVRREDGTVPASLVIREIFEIIKGTDGKKS